MAKRSRRRNQRSAAPPPPPPPPQDEAGHSVAAHVRDRQRAVAEREASRLARPEKRPTKSIGHADRKKSAVTSTPFGLFARQDKDGSIKESQQGWCGPFSVARQMIAEREEARRKQEAEEEDSGLEPAHPLDQAMEELDMEKKRKAHPSINWKAGLPEVSTSQSLYAKRQKRADLRSQGRGVPSLFELCVNFLVDNFEYVESLGDVDTSIRTAVVKELVASNKMDGHSFEAIAEVGIEALEMVDCSQVTQEQLSKSLRQLLPAGLRYLVLDQSGRCFGPKAVEAIVECSQKTSLFALSVGGAYLLNDKVAAKLIDSMGSTVASLEFKACPLLKMDFCKSISDTFSSTGKLLELSFEDLSLSKECLAALIAEPSSLSNLKSLAMRRIPEVDDDIVDKLLETTSGSLEGLDLSDNLSLTDSVLGSIRRCCVGLRALNLSGLRHLTAAGLEALFTHVPNMAAPPMLVNLNLGRCDHEAVTDDVINLVTQAATKKRDGVIDQMAFLGGLVNLGIQGSSLVTDTAMECLAATCGSSLRELNVSFCPRISDKGLGYLVDNLGPQLEKIQMWGCAQITDEFLDGHRRVDDPAMEITGVWMKKNSLCAVR